MARIVQVTAEQCRGRFWAAVARAGIDRDFLDRKLADDGVDAAREWLTAHCFYDVADALNMYGFLLADEPL